MTLSCTQNSLISPSSTSIAAAPSTPLGSQAPISSCPSAAALIANSLHSTAVAAPVAAGTRVAVTLQLPISLPKPPPGQADLPHPPNTTLSAGICRKCAGGIPSWRTRVQCTLTLTAPALTAPAWDTGPTVKAEDGSHETSTAVPAARSGVPLSHETPACTGHAGFPLLGEIAEFEATSAAVLHMNLFRGTPARPVHHPLLWCHKASPSFHCVPD